jgi:IS1 family transposase
VQLDEKWDFVHQKEKHCDAEDRERGDCWDHVAFDPEHRLVVSLVVGKRTEDATHELVRDFHGRTGGRIMRLMTSDEYPVYAEAIRQTYGQVVTPPRTGRRGRPRQPQIVVPPQLTYATVHKERDDHGRVVKVRPRLVFGTYLALVVALVVSTVSRRVNISFVERHNGTDRNRCSRKVRKSYGFSKQWVTHRLATQFSYFSYNFCWPVATLRKQDSAGRWQARTPAMAAGLTDHVWTIAEWLAMPAVQRR